MKRFLYLLIFSFMIPIIDSKEEEEKDIFEEYKNLRFCGTDLIKHEVKFFSNSIKSAKIRHLSTEYRPIRIFLETTHFENEASKSSFSKDKISLIKGALNKAIKAFESLLEVEDVNNPNLFNNVTSVFSYYKIESWSDVFNKGGDIKSDFIWVVTLDYNALTSSFPIMQDKNTKRPIVGLLKLSRHFNMYNYKRAEEYLSEVFLHELTHALGFLDTMFKYYQYGLTKTLTTKKNKR